jgi:hypothetical protein
MKGVQVHMALLDQRFALIAIMTDLRLSKASGGQRSINLAISARGIVALQAIDAGIAARFLKTIIPVHGRMIHYINGDTAYQAYDRHGQVRDCPRLGD